MRFNKTVKALAVVLPIMALSACSSSDTASEDASAMQNNQAAMAEQKARDDAERVKVEAMQRADAIEAKKRQEIEKLRSEHIVYFDFDKSSVSGDFAAILEAHAKFLNENSNVNVLIEGHADERGTPEYNIALGERRAKSIETFLENMGVSASQLSTVSYGEEKPMVKDRSEGAFAKNRRAVLVY
ncbi:MULTISPECIES: peptidoglycan-associated lipoprotein Pal [unclassified Colwellia]|jgi:peptidoglycan-associated lipoprotein|uniref:peptidoglycan-associated lipoprotein Pal n=1 Tax=unclassified Colwellia TaxID=196834 RepID=UPI000D3509FC|nr:MULTISPECIES: peptidoglycan-associated lipoprotein Pal [unclassified Colwellia]AWB58457.1 peptidoglycan-associated lipoprotein Pal [Colwellia sp. Arc7-D]MBA6416170.1 peptidoglycan-associated lipoprotein Pal [Colwellia sp. 6M3]|tara:strand:- start:2489 stop:3043 length:555 start_codon:yes stop_codon:yes gene_type:complete